MDILPETKLNPPWNYSIYFELGSGFNKLSILQASCLSRCSRSTRRCSRFRAASRIRIRRSLSNGRSDRRILFLFLVASILESASLEVLGALQFGHIMRSLHWMQLHPSCELHIWSDQKDKDVNLVRLAGRDGCKMGGVRPISESLK